MARQRQEDLVDLPGPEPIPEPPKALPAPEPTKKPEPPQAPVIQRKSRGPWPSDPDAKDFILYLFSGLILFCMGIFFLALFSSRPAHEYQTLSEKYDLLWMVMEELKAKEPKAVNTAFDEVAFRRGLDVRPEFRKRGK